MFAKLPMAPLEGKLISGYLHQANKESHPQKMIIFWSLSPPHPIHKNEI